MGYFEISQMSSDLDLTSRIQACVAQETHDVDVYQWTAQHALDLAGAPGWDAAWSSALAGGNETPGRDPGVITDGMILSEVQAELAEGRT